MTEYDAGSASRWRSDRFGAVTSRLDPDPDSDPAHGAGAVAGGGDGPVADQAGRLGQEPQPGLPLPGERPDRVLGGLEGGSDGGGACRR
jgi:hypothetical protein